MSRPWWISRVFLLGVLGVYSQNILAQDYVVTAGREQLHFTRRPELGYVVVSRGEKAAIEATKQKLQEEVSANDIRPVQGLGRRGVSVVYHRRSANENEGTFKVLRGHKHTRYAAPLFSSNGETLGIIPEIVVRLRAATDAEKLSVLCESLNLAVSRRLEFTDLEYLIEVLAADSDDVFTAVEQLNASVFVEWAVPNVAFRPKLFGQVMPNDTYFPDQWHLNNTGQSGGTYDADIDAPEAWEITIGDPNIVVAVLDDGIDTSHPDLINNIVVGYDFYDDNNDPSPTGDAAHGTACAGLIAAHGNNGTGVTGVTWNCKIMPVRIIGASGFVTDADIATAIRWAAVNAADIMSISWGGDFTMSTIHSAIIDVTEPGGIGRNGKGCVILGASGNWLGSSYRPVVYPAKYDEVIAVGATSHDDGVFTYSGRGPELELVAPSGWYNLQGNVWTTDIVGSAGYNNRDAGILDYTDKMGGTSGACPLAAGVAALVLSIDPEFLNSDVRYVLRVSADDLGTPGFDERYGYGRVNAYAAVDRAIAPAPESIYVDDNAPDDPGPGDPSISDPLEDGSPTHPFDAIQEAIDTASWRGKVVVEEGIYTGMGNRDLDFSGRAITVCSVSPDDPNVVANTVIDCNGISDLEMFLIEPHRAFYFHNGENRNSVIAGFTIKRGLATTGSYDYSGGAIYCVSSSPTIRNCTLTNNQATEGGAICCEGGASRPKILDCLIKGNIASGGGGIKGGNPHISNCQFINNLAYGSGGGVCECGEGPMNNCVFIANSARSGSGGGIYEFYGNIANCTIAQNTAYMYGGGLYCWDRSSMTNCIIMSNYARLKGGGVYLYSVDDGTLKHCTIANNMPDGIHSYSYSSEPPNMVNCIIWGNNSQQVTLHGGQIQISYCDVEGGRAGIDETGGSLFWGDGNIDADPRFFLGGDYHLDYNSPCIDSGTDVNVFADFEDNLRPLGEGFDMGACEYNDSVPFIAVAPSSTRFYVSKGAPNVVPQAVYIGNCGAGTLSWEISADANWLNFNPGTGSSSGEIESFDVWPDITTLSHGRYSASLTVSAPGAFNTPRKIWVELYVNQTFNVDANGMADYVKVQHAIDATIDGDTVVVFPGIYPENIRFYGQKITVQSRDPCDQLVVDATILDGGNTGAEVVEFSGTESSETILSGFTITNGGGGGINGGEGTLATITHCVVIDNHYKYDGGGIRRCNGIIADCAITENRATSAGDYGGGLYQCGGTITRCFVANNSANQGGGGFAYCDGSISNCIILGNGAGGVGGGMASCGKVANCIFSGNIAGRGGAICGAGEIVDSTFSGNVAFIMGGALYSSDPTATNCIFWGNSDDGGSDESAQIYTSSGTPTVNYTCVQGWTGSLGGTGNFGENPCFVRDPNDGGDGWGLGDNDDYGDLHVSPLSPCIDTGDNTAVSPDISDLDRDGNTVDQRQLFLPFNDN
jgi:subtilisin family serine protease